jgi:alanine racemase
VKVEHKIDVFLKLDSGMHRLGFRPKPMLDALDRLKAMSHIGNITLISHFARADEGKEHIQLQLDAFHKAIEGLKLPTSLANSAALMRYPETLGDWVRPGIMLYGASPFADETGESLGLLPVMTLESEIIAIQSVRKGEGVGYGHLFTAPHDIRVGIVACGYADGYPRHAINGTPVLVEGRPSQTIGRVSMDMLHVDLSDNGHAHVGSPVTLWGNGCPVESVATAAGTISYELLTALAPRVRIEER